MKADMMMMMIVFISGKARISETLTVVPAPDHAWGLNRIDDFQHTRSSSVYLLGRFCSRCAASWLAPTVGIFYLTASFFFACPSVS